MKKSKGGKSVLSMSNIASSNHPSHMAVFGNTSAGHSSHQRGGKKKKKGR